MCFNEVNGEWMVLGYKAALWCFRNPEKLSSKCSSDFDPLVVGNDPPDHTRYRKILARAMSGCDSKMVDSYTTDWMVGFLQRTKDSGGRFDGVRDLARPLPEMFGGAFLGFDESETQQLIAMRPENSTQLTQSWSNVTKYLEQVVSVGRGGERRGILGELYSLSCAEGVSDAQVVGLLRLFWFAGTSTSTHFLPSLLLLMLSNPDLVKRLLADRSLVPLFVTEALRREGSVATVPRWAMVDCALMGVRIPANASVRIIVLAANNDPAVFTEPQKMRLNRSTPSLAFGHGIHSCLGVLIAKAMAAKVVEMLLENFPAMIAAQDLDSVSYERSDSFRAIHSLQIQLF